MAHGLWQRRFAGDPNIVGKTIALDGASHTVIGIMPGFWLLNVLGAQHVGGYLNPVFFTATGMIGMISIFAQGSPTAPRASRPAARGTKAVLVRRTAS